MKRILPLLLALLMLVSAASCGTNPDPADTGTESSADSGTAAPESTAPAETKRSEAKDTLPADYKLNGRKIGILTRDNELRQMDVDGGGEELGEVVYDAVYARTRSVEERLVCDIEVTAIPGNFTTFGTTMEQNILAGDDVWQIVNTPGNASLTAQRDYLFQQLQDNKYLDLDQPWWNGAAMDEISIDGKQIRYLVGDISLSMHHYSGAMFFNKRLFVDYGGNQNDLYQTVIDRKWTYDKLREISAGMYKDVNGDGAADENDVYGFTIFTTEDVKYLEYGADVRRYSRGSDGTVVIDYDLERADTAVTKILTLLNETTGARYLNSKSRDFSIFTGGKSVFIGSFLGVSTFASLRSMEDPYGVIPFPMLDDRQTEYTNFIHDSAAYYAVPITCADADAAGAVLEAMCAETYRSVIDIYFETALKTKYASDSQSGQCIDIIRAASRKYFLAEHNKLASQSGFLIAKQVANGSNQLASDYAAVLDTGNKNIRDLVEKYQKQDAAAKQ